MRFFVLTLLIAFLVVFASASLPQKAVIVSFPNETPDYIVIEAKEGLKAAGGEITHEYRKPSLCWLIQVHHTNILQV